jgi:hemoglobin-like flavoprotein
MTDPVTASFELASERCADLTPHVYERLFAEHPDMQPLFVNDRTGKVRDEMLYRVIETILDFVGSLHYAVGMVHAEVQTHDGYGVPRDVFPKFFAVVADTLRQILAEDWTAEMDAGWRRLVAELSAIAQAA